MVIMSDTVVPGRMVLLCKGGDVENQELALQSYSKISIIRPSLRVMSIPRLYHELTL